MFCDVSRQQGFSLSEIMIAIGAFVAAILIVLALSISLTRMNRETVDRSVATSLGTRVLERTLREIRTSDVPVTQASFWQNDYPTGSPLATGTVRVGTTDFSYQITAMTVMSGANPVGSLAPDNRLKRVSIELEWYGGERAGYGRTSARLTRLVRQGEEW
ncbi:MAG: hypothetical protein AMXMBFR33_51250 [Candidatus Xenobia bacterium]